MEFVQFHPTGMVWPPSVKGILVTESVRGDGGVLRNSEGKRFMFDYVPDVFRAQYAETEEEADRWYTDPDNNRRPPELLPRDEVARAINSEVKAGRGSPHGGVFLDVSTRLPAEEIMRRLPSMYHQFKELADVDITAEPMEVGPTCHYVMGGVEVDPDTAATAVPGLFAAGEVAGGMHGSNRLGGNSLSDLLVFGRRAGLGAAEYLDGLSGAPTAPRSRHRCGRGRGAGAAGAVRRGEPVHGALRAAADDERPGRHHPAGAEMTTRSRSWRSSRSGRLRSARRAAPATTRAGTWRSTCATCCWWPSAWRMAALERQESRGGHTRDDYPEMSPEWRKVNLMLSMPGDHITLWRQPVISLRPDLLELFESLELKKYLTDEELPAEPVAAAPGTAGSKESE